MPASEPTPLETATMVELWQEIARRVTARPTGAAILVYTDKDDANFDFYRTLFCGSTVSMYGLANIVRDQLRQKALFEQAVYRQRQMEAQGEDGPDEEPG